MKNKNKNKNVNVNKSTNANVNENTNTNANESTSANVNESTNTKHTNENFDISKYIENNEGLFPKLFRLIREKLNSILKFKIIGIKFQWIGIFISLIGVIIAAVELFKKDTGEIIEEIYQESKANVAETYKYISMVQLSDSLENTEEVKKLRALQNEILKYHIFQTSTVIDIESFVENVKYAKENGILKDHKDEYLDQVLFLGEKIQQLFKLSKNINNKFITSAISFALNNDSIAMSSIRINEFYQINFLQEKLEAKLNIHSTKINIEVKQKDVYGAVELLTDFFTSNELIDVLNAIRKQYLGYINSINIYLLNVKNNNQALNTSIDIEGYKNAYNAIKKRPKNDILGKLNSSKKIF